MDAIQLAHTRAKSGYTHRIFGIGSAVLLLLTVIGAAHPFPVHDDRIPAFARKYRTSCSTCHVAAPKLNVLGEAFRLNGYRFPENNALLRRDAPVPLGADEWKDLWPRSIWPGDISGYLPLALRVQNDVQVTRNPSGGHSWSYRFPHELYILAASTLGESFGVFLETEWSQERGLEVLQAKVKFQDVVPWLPKRSLNVWIGAQNLYLFTFADRQIDRAGRQVFLWQEHRASDLLLANQQTLETLQSQNTFQLRQPQPAVELNGILSGRLYYGVGVAQGATGTTTDNNNAKDLYYKVRTKIGGLRLDGGYGVAGAPVLGTGGQLLDETLIIEHFGYFGKQPVEGGRQDNHRAFGVNARVLYGPLDIGAGYVWGRNDNPWGVRATGSVRHSSLFGKVEYLLFPWLIASGKLESFDVDVPTPPAPSAFTLGGSDQQRVLPGIIVLLRQNVRGVLEAELFTEHESSAELNTRKPHKLWFRLDVAF